MRRSPKTPSRRSPEQLVARVLSDLAAALNHDRAEVTVGFERLLPNQEQSLYGLLVTIKSGFTDEFFVPFEDRRRPIDGFTPDEAFRVVAQLFHRIIHSSDRQLRTQLRALAHGDQDSDGQ